MRKSHFALLLICIIVSSDLANCRVWNTGEPVPDTTTSTKKNLRKNNNSKTNTTTSTNNGSTGTTTTTGGNTGTSDNGTSGSSNTGNSGSLPNLGDILGGLNGNTNTDNGSTGTTTTGSTDSGNTGSNSGSTTTNTGNTGNSNTGSSTNTGSTPTPTPTPSTSTGNTKLTDTSSSGGSCPNGGSVVTSGLTASEKQLLLDLHNQYRNTVAKGDAPGQPGATDMLEMIWDEDVAKKAQEWADQCNFSHNDKSQRATSKFSTVGQNLAIITSSSNTVGDFKRLVKGWYDEVNQYSGPVSSFNGGSGTGHYTQMVWAASYALGCGYQKYSNGGYNYLLVCNYAPAGNFIGRKVYTQGTFSASNCDNGASSTYPFLCKA